MTAPAGSMSLAEGHLAATLAASAAWQSECGAANATEALAHIYDDGLANLANGEVHPRGELENVRPYAMVFMPASDPFGRRKVAVRGFDGYGTLGLRIVRNSPTQVGDSPTHDDNQTFKNLVGTIIDELCDLAEGAGYLNFHTIHLASFSPWPAKEDIETWGLFQAAEFLLHW